VVFFGLVWSDFFIASEAPGGIADSGGPICPTVAPGGGPPEAPDSPQPASDAAINKALIVRIARRMDFASTRDSMKEMARRAPRPATLDVRGYAPARIAPLNTGRSR
jgi:hypothetical protein